MKQNKQRPEITVTREDKNGLIEFGTTKEVKKSGNTGHITLPKALIGKRVEVYYLKEKKK